MIFYGNIMYVVSINTVTILLFLPSHYFLLVRSIYYLGQCRFGKEIERGIANLSFIKETKIILIVDVEALTFLRYPSLTRMTFMVILVVDNGRMILLLL